MKADIVRQMMTICGKDLPPECRPVEVRVTPKMWRAFVMQLVSVSRTTDRPVFNDDDSRVHCLSTVVKAWPPMTAEDANDVVGKAA